MTKRASLRAAILADVQAEQKAAGQSICAWTIKTPTMWWATSSRMVYDAWDWPDEDSRKLVLAEAERLGVLYQVGPASMDGPQVMAAIMTRHGDEVRPEDLPGRGTIRGEHNREFS